MRTSCQPGTTKRGAHRFDDFIIYNEPRRSDQLRLMGRGLADRLRPGRS
jgi:hydroxyacylglutathione hydrolase